MVRQQARRRVRCWGSSVTLSPRGLLQPESKLGHGKLYAPHHIGDRCLSWRGRARASETASKLSLPHLEAGPIICELFPGFGRPHFRLEHENNSEYHRFFILHRDLPRPSSLRTGKGPFSQSCLRGFRIFWCGKIATIPQRAPSVTLRKHGIVWGALHLRPS